jgi:hypothetical protein
MIDKPEARRFPPPWIAEETDACFIIRDHSGYALAYVYFEEEPGRRSAAKLLSKDEARRIASNIAKLPDRKSNFHSHKKAAWRHRHRSRGIVRKRLTQPAD